MGKCNLEHLGEDNTLVTEGFNPPFNRLPDSLQEITRRDRRRVSQRFFRRRARQLEHLALVAPQYFMYPYYKALANAEDSTPIPKQQPEEQERSQGEEWQRPEAFQQRKRLEEGGESLTPTGSLQPVPVRKPRQRKEAKATQTAQGKPGGALPPD